MRTLNPSSGAAAYCTTSTLSTVSCRSGMRALADESGPLLERCKKGVDLAPDLGATRQPVPVRADQADQLVALVDGHNVILRRVRTSTVPDTIDKQSGHIRFHLIQNWIRL